MTAATLTIESGGKTGAQEAATDAAVSLPRKARSGMSKPRLGFLGVGWIGLHRMETVLRSGAAEIGAVADSSESALDRAIELVPQAGRMQSLEDLLGMDLDGIVIATPSALHADQAVAALERGIAVFSQKPLGRNAAESRRVIEAARQSDRLLGVDFSYRFISGVEQIHQLCRNGELGEIFAADLVFHNAYGPDKGWFYNPALSGGGCVIDLGIHLVDLALWNLGFPRIARVTSHLFFEGAPITDRSAFVEDYAVAHLFTRTGAAISLACSWRLHAGTDAFIGGAFYGTRGGAAFRNINGSFHDFRAERFRGTTSEVLADAPEHWGGRALLDWTRRLANGERFDPENERLVEVADTLDRIYENSRVERNSGAEDPV